MDDNPSSGTPIAPPRPHKAAKVARSLAKAAVGSVPVAGAALGEAVDLLAPDPEAKDRNRWETEITDGVNDLNGRVDYIDRRGIGGRQITIADGAAVAAAFMVKHCRDGLGMDDVSADDICAAHPEMTRDDILNGLGELESYGLIESTSFIGADDIYCLTQRGYETLDPPLLGFSPRDDARQVAALAIEQRECVLTHKIATELGWPRRRFNPALQVVIDRIHPGHVSNERQATYVTLQFNPSNAEIARLRRFANGEEDWS